MSFVVDRPDDLAPLEVPIATPAAPGLIPIVVHWFGAESTKVRIQAFKYTMNADGSPQHYTGYDSTELSPPLTEQVTWKASWKAPTFKEKKVSVSIDLPSSYEIFQSVIRVRQNGARYGQSLMWNIGSATAMSFVVPDLLAGPIFDFEVCAYNGYNTSCRTQPGLSGGDEVHPVSVEEGPGSPWRASIWVSGRRSRGPPTATARRSCCSTPATPSSKDPSFFIAGGDEVVTLPDVSKLGVKLPKGADYKVAVFRNSAAETVDELGLKGPTFTPTDEASTYANSIEAPVKT